MYIHFEVRFVYIHMYIYIYVCICFYIYACIYIYVYRYIYTCLFTYIYVYIYVCYHGLFAIYYSDLAFASPMTVREVTFHAVLCAWHPQLTAFVWWEQGPITLHSISHISIYPVFILHRSCCALHSAPYATYYSDLAFASPMTVREVRNFSSLLL